MKERFPFTKELRAMARERDQANERNVRTALIQLADYPDVEGIWTRIKKACGEGSAVRMRFFISEVLSAKYLAANVDQWPDYLAHAKEAESLARFLKGSGRLPPPLPGMMSSGFVPVLEEVALTLRRQAKNSQIHKSRENSRGSREYNAFMQLMSLSMQELFGRWFDSEVADLTDVFFPDADATVDSVHTARQRRQRRAGK